MFCPKCGSEYRPEFTRCAECDVDLVPDLPQSAEAESEYPEYQEVLSTYSPSDVAFIKSLLDGEGITYFFQGESLAPYVYYALPMRLFVKEDEIETAAAIVKDVDLSLLPYDGRIEEEQNDGE